MNVPILGRAVHRVHGRPPCVRTVPRAYVPSSPRVPSVQRFCCSSGRVSSAAAARSCCPCSRACCCGGGCCGCRRLRCARRRPCSRALLSRTALVLPLSSTLALALAFRRMRARTAAQQQRRRLDGLRVARALTAPTPSRGISEPENPRVCARAAGAGGLCDTLRGRARASIVRDSRTRIRARPSVGRRMRPGGRTRCRAASAQRQATRPPRRPAGRRTRAGGPGLGRLGRRGSGRRCVSRVRFPTGAWPWNRARCRLLLQEQWSGRLLQKP